VGGGEGCEEILSDRSYLASKTPSPFANLFDILLCRTASARFKAIDVSCEDA
jgi:hypothetical protein